MLGVLLFVSCKQRSDIRSAQLSIDDYQDLRVAEYALDAQKIEGHLKHFLSADPDSTTIDRKVRQYFKGEGVKVWWTGRCGWKSQADTLMTYLKNHLAANGLSERSFGMPEIDDCMNRLRHLDASGKQDVNRLFAELEYRLTKAYVRYAEGQRYGFCNPQALFNLRETDRNDSLKQRIVFKRQYVIETEQPPKDYVGWLMHKVAADSVGGCLRDAEPRDEVYVRYAEELKQTTGAERRNLLLVNMERRRWRMPNRPTANDRHIFVNVAAQQLWATGPDSIMNMRVVCGASATKTPLLISAINLIQVNPIWSIPYSIIVNEVLNHAGDSAYFARNRYYAVNRETSEQTSASSLSAAQLRSGRYGIAQHAGPGNSLGRIVFRFPNEFSVYLHDTSNPRAFNNARRTLSHGCVRVQRPFDLACFLLPDADEWMFDRLRISMDIAPETDKGREYLSAHPDERGKHRLITSTSVSPAVPVYIDYFTIYPNPATHEMQSWTDVYGYDKLIMRAIKPFT